MTSSFNERGRRVITTKWSCGLSGYRQGCRCETCKSTNTESCRRYAEANRERVTAIKRRHYDANVDVIKARAAQWNASDKGKIARVAYNNRRRANILSAEANDFTKFDWMELLVQYDYSCVYCGKGGKLTQDHKTPLIRGGNHTKANIVPACGSCNSRKGRKTIAEWRSRPH